MWAPWVNMALDLMDGKGTFSKWNYPGERAAQPAYDMEVLRVIRQRWVNLMNKRMEEKAKDGGRRLRTR
jgi:hypothetical protein